MILAAKNKNIAGICLLCLMATILVACAPPKNWYFVGNSMGTRYHITVVPPADALKTQYSFLETGFTRIVSELNNALSTYLPESNLSRFNQASVAQWHEVDVHVAELALISKKIHASSDGKFDAGVGALVEIWGFGARDTASWQVPNMDQVHAILERSGIRWLDVNTARHSLRKNKDLYLDFSAIAKGYAVDKMAELLITSNYDNYLIEFGGEIRSGGRNSRAQLWRVGVVKPDPDAPLGNEVYRVIDLPINTALATSGEYRNYVLVNGQRYSHTIDPVNGKPIPHQWSSVTVLHPSATYADAWATALNVMGYEQGIDFANRQQLAVLFVVRENNGDQFTHYTSELFPRIADPPRIPSHQDY